MPLDLMDELLAVLVQVVLWVFTNLGIIQ
jgi:hypothetical protein